MVETIINNLGVWTSAQSVKSSGRGRSASNQSAHGISKLRELILGLAIQGKLIPQNANDESASLLLEKIANEKKHLIKEGKIKKQEPLSEITKNEKQFDLPIGWVWVRLGEVSEFINGFAFKSTDFTDVGIGIVKIGDIQNGEITSSSMSRVREDIVTSLDDSFKVSKGNLLIAMSGATTGKLGFNKTNEVFYMNQRVGKILPYCLLIKYLFYPLTTKIAENLAKSMGSAIPNLSTVQIKNIVFALPPFAEQQRIVDKVDELMALCDQLEQQQTDSNAAHEILVETLLDTLSNAADQSELESAWERIASHFDTLFTTEHSVDRLKQTILQLAVMGKLVPQNPADEPAGELLKKIGKEKARLAKEGKIKKQNILPEIEQDEKVFDLPTGWIWTRLGDSAIRSEAGWSPNCNSTPREGVNWGVLKVSAVTWGSFNEEENKALPSGLKPRPEYEIMPGDFLISRANTSDLVARAVVVPKDVSPHLMMSDKTIRFVFSQYVSVDFINLVNSSSFSRVYYSRVAGGTSGSMKNVSREQIRSLIIALPPLAEQQLIVAKVDELFGICDALKKRIREAQGIQIDLANAVVEGALS